MREVTLYTFEKKRVLAGAYVEVMNYNGTPWPINGSEEFIAAQPVDVTRLPVHTFSRCSPGGGVKTTYVAMDEPLNTIVEHYRIRADQTAAQAVQARDVAKNETAKLEKVYTAGFLTRLKWLFTGVTV